MQTSKNSHIVDFSIQ